MNTKWRGRLEITGLIVFLLLLALMLFYFYGAWVWQPLMLTGFGVLGTQFGAAFGRIILSDLASKIPEKPSQSDEEIMLNTKDAELSEVIKNRNKQAQTPAGAALNSYLSQVVGTFAMVVLNIGACLILMSHRIFGVERPYWVATVAGFILATVAGLLVWLLVKVPLSSKSLSPYYNWNGFLPPLTTLTFFRIVVLIIYSVLVFILYCPNPKPAQTPSSSSPSANQGA